MSPFTFVLILIFLVVVVPAWIFFNFLGKLRSNRMLSSEDEKMLAELWQVSRKMEDRINVLETILKSEKGQEGSKS